MISRDLLFEIGSEEIPAQFVTWGFIRTPAYCSGGARRSTAGMRRNSDFGNAQKTDAFNQGPVSQTGGFRS